MSSTSPLLPFQPMSMTTAQLAAVSFLARYGGHTHDLYSYQLRRWFEWWEGNGQPHLSCFRGGGASSVGRLRRVQGLLRQPTPEPAQGSAVGR